MSLRNRARSLQKRTGLSYQQALARLRALGERPARLHRQTGWPLEVCDRYLVDGHAPIEVCDRYAVAADAPIEVIGPAVDERIGALCESLRVTANARVVMLAQQGRLIACAGEQSAAATLALKLLSLRPPPGERPLPQAPDVWEAEDGSGAYKMSIKRALLIVRFHRDETSLGLVKLRARHAAEKIAPLLDDDEAATPPFGGSGGGGAGGVPNELRVVAPVPATRPRRRPTPIGRKKR